jgi:hypothetical protein
MSKAVTRTETGSSVLAENSTPDFDIEGSETSRQPLSELSGLKWTLVL